MKVAVHDGLFHTDEVFAVAIIKLVYPKAKVIRTRDQNIFGKADLRVDVGKKYNPKTGDYDHHQSEFVEKRGNGIPYSSAGLVWRHFGNKLVKSKEAFDYIDSSLIQPIDAYDNGMDLCSSGTVKPVLLQRIVLSMRPSWKETEPDMDGAFAKAVDFAISFLEREIRVANELKDAMSKIKRAAAHAKKEYIIFDPPTPPWKEVGLEELKGIKFVVSRYSKEKWYAESVPVRQGSFEAKCLFPEAWANLEGEKFAAKTGVKDALFCHKLRFVVFAKSREGAVRLVELALRQSSK